MINFEKNIIFIGDIINIRLFFVEIATFRRSSRGRKILGLIKNIARDGWKFRMEEYGMEFHIWK